MQHPSDRQLGAYLDGELRQGAERVQQHLGICPECAARADELHGVCRRVQATAPLSAHWCSEGEFWARLAGRLEPRARETWPWLPFLPPVFLGALVTGAQVALSLIVTAYLLVRWGVFPSLGQPLAERLAAWVASPFVEGTVLSWLGISAQQVAEAVQRGGAIYEVFLFGAIAVVVSVALGLALGLYAIWAACFSRHSALRSVQRRA